MSDGAHVVNFQLAQISLNYSFETNPFFHFTENNFFFYCIMPNHICSTETVNKVFFLACRLITGSALQCCMYVNPTCVSEIKNILFGMQSKSSCGLEEVPMSIFKLSPDNILLILCHIFNLSLGQGKFINEFKKAKIIPVHKKGSKTNVNNYQPISLLLVMSKILERIFYKRLRSFLSQVDFFHQYQFGFRKKHSTSNAFTVMVENVTKAFEEKNIHWVFSWICQRL